MKANWWKTPVWWDLTSEKKWSGEIFSRKIQKLLKYQDMLGESNPRKNCWQRSDSSAIFMDDEKPTISLWRSGFVRYAVGIAAAFFIVMVTPSCWAFRWTIQTKSSRLALAMVNKESPRGLSPQQVQLLIDASLTQNNKTMQASLSESPKQVERGAQQNAALTSNPWTKSAKQPRPQRRRKFVSLWSGCVTRNSQPCKIIYGCHPTNQRQYIETLLVDFQSIYAKQRNSDLTVVNYVSTHWNKTIQHSAKRPVKFEPTNIEQYNSSVKRN